MIGGSLQAFYYFHLLDARDLAGEYESIAHSISTLLIMDIASQLLLL